jgi:hypothetical protein
VGARTTADLEIGATDRTYATLGCL